MYVWKYFQGLCQNNQILIASFSYFYVHLLSRVILKECRFKKIVLDFKIMWIYDTKNRIVSKVIQYMINCCAEFKICTVFCKYYLCSCITSSSPTCMKQILLAASYCIDQGCSNFMVLGHSKLIRDFKSPLNFVCH
jgi:hypothetical protein